MQWFCFRNGAHGEDYGDSYGGDGANDYDDDGANDCESDDDILVHDARCYHDDDYGGANDYESDDDGLVHDVRYYHDDEHDEVSGCDVLDVIRVVVVDVRPYFSYDAKGHDGFHDGDSSDIRGHVHDDDLYDVRVHVRDDEPYGYRDGDSYGGGGANDLRDGDPFVLLDFRSLRW